MSARCQMVAAAMIFLIQLAGCGGTEPTATPLPATHTPTPVPPTETPVPTDTPVPTATPTRTPIPTPTLTPTPLPEAGAVITSTSRNDPVSLPTLTPTRPSLPETMETIRLRLDVTERTWMQVTIDGEVVCEGLGRQGDEPYEWEAQESAHLLAGNGIGLFVTVNDVELGKLGGRGEVLDETWTTTGEG